MISSIRKQLSQYQFDFEGVQNSYANSFLFSRLQLPLDNFNLEERYAQLKWGEKTVRLKRWVDAQVDEAACTHALLRGETSLERWKLLAG